QHSPRWALRWAISILTVSVLALFATSALVSHHGAAQEAKPPSLPLPEMQRLSKLYVGSWTYTETYPKSARMPNRRVNTRLYTSELGPGGNSIINRVHSKGSVGEFEGILIMTWDPKERAYKAFALGDSFPGALVEIGQWEGDAVVYRSEFSVGSTKLALRNSTKFPPDGKLISEQFTSANGAPEILLVHVEAIRK